PRAGGIKARRAVGRGGGAGGRKRAHRRSFRAAGAGDRLGGRGHLSPDAFLVRPARDAADAGEDLFPERFRGGGRAFVSGGARAGRRKVKKRRVLIVDGYNVLNAWKDVQGMDAGSLSDARDALAARLMDYAG